LDDGFGAILRSLQIRSAYRHRYAMPAHSAARPGPSPDQLEAGTPGYRRANLAMFVGGFATFAMVYSTQPLLPLLAAEFGVGAASASLTVSATTAGLALMLIPASVLADRLGGDAPWEVFGSDISREVVEKARGGVYAMHRIDGIPPDYLRRYCLRGVGSRDGTLQVDAALRRRVRFAQVNLNGNLAGVGDFDVVFLRNVLIYFDLPTKRRIVERIVRQMRPGGWLFIGHSESLNGLDLGLRQERPTIYRRM